MAKHMERKEKRKLRSRIFTIIISLLLIGVLSVAFLLYGPYHGFRDWIITVAMTSMTHQWIPKLFYSDKTIEINESQVNYFNPEKTGDNFDKKICNRCNRLLDVNFFECSTSVGL